MTWVRCKAKAVVRVEVRLMRANIIFQASFMAMDRFDARYSTRFYTWTMDEMSLRQGLRIKVEWVLEFGLGIAFRVMFRVMVRVRKWNAASGFCLIF